MKKKKIIAVISIFFISSSLTMTGCGSVKETVNKNLTISKENVSSKSSLKIESIDEIFFENPLMDKQYSLKFDKNGKLLVEQIESEVDKSLALYGNVNIEGDKAVLEYLTSTRYENISNSSIQFNVEYLSEGRVKISNNIGEEGYEIDSNLISNENSRYSLSENVLFEYVINNEGITERIIWNDLSNENTGVIDIPNNYKSATAAEVMGDKIVIAALSKTDGISLPNNLLIVDLNENKITEEILIGTFGFILPIDEERIILLGSLGNDSTLEMYNIKTKERNELFKYAYNDSDEESLNISYAGLFPSKDKLYYCEYTSETAYIKVAKIKGMGIESPITVCEFNINDEYISEPPKIIISNDNKDMIIYYKNAMSNSIDKFYKVKLNK